MQQQHEKMHCGYVEGDLTAFEEDDSTSNCSSQVWSEQKCRRTVRAVLKSRTGRTCTCDEGHGCDRNKQERQKRCDQRKKDDETRRASVDRYASACYDLEL